MYVTNQKPKYYIWDFRKGESFKTFNSKMDFLVFIAKQFREYSTIVLNEVDLDFKKEHLKLTPEEFVEVQQKITSAL